MTNEHSVEEFLRVEEQATSLLDELAKLRQETDSYVTASGALSDAAQGLRPLADRLAQTAEGVQGVSTVLRDIGTPELSAGIERLARRLDDVGHRVAAIESRLVSQGDAMESHGEAVTGLAGALDGVKSFTGNWFVFIGLTIIGCTAALMVAVLR